MGTLALLMLTVLAAGETVGVRPYELEWAGRATDACPPIVDFEDLEGWHVVRSDGSPSAPSARFERSREQQIWGDHVGKLTYRDIGVRSALEIRPPTPISISGAFDAVTLWVYGNNWGWSPDPRTPQVSVRVLYEDAQGNDVSIDLHRVDWKEWNLLHRRLTPQEIERLREGARFKAIGITGGTNPEDRVLYFDNLAVFVETFPPLEFEPRPRRGIPMFPGQSTGTNTGPGKLPFPTRPETILPPNLADGFTTTLQEVAGGFIFEYRGPDGHLTYRFVPQSGCLSDIEAQWAGRGRPFRPCVDGGVLLDIGGRPTPPDHATEIETRREKESVVSQWRLGVGDVEAEVTFTYRLWGKSLVVDVVAPGGRVAEVRYGRATGLDGPRLVTNPFYVYGWGANRPAVVVSGPSNDPLFLAGNTDWCVSGSSSLFAANAVGANGVVYNGGTRYIPKTDGKRNDCFERLFLTVSPRYEEVLPTIPNPPSPWKHVTGTRVWRAHGASDRESDAAHWRECHRYGMTQIIVTDHETGWRDGGESFTFRTRAAPGKGGDSGQYEYARIMQDELGFVYGPYNNYTDFAPVNGFWNFDMVNRTSDNQLQHAWMRCYAPKPARAVEYCARLAPEIQKKFQFSTAYCDVHTAVAPWDRVDYDPRVPGAGTFGAVFYAYGEIMLLQKRAWSGPVYSEGGYHYLYCGLTDGNYGQDNPYQPWKNPWLVDFDLRRMHDLCCNFGMGNLGMFYGSSGFGGTREEMDASLDRFLAATVAFGHPGFLVYEGGLRNALRSYYMLQQLHSRYCLASAEDIRYVDREGKLLDTTAAVATGAYERSQVVTRYSDGTVTVSNGHPEERLRVLLDGRDIDLPPNGYVGYSPDETVFVESGDRDGHRVDYADTPAYIYVDGRGQFTRFPKAASDGIAICRKLDKGHYEVIPYEGAECGFALPTVTARALARDRSDLGPARVRRARGLVYVEPVEGALSYILTPTREESPTSGVRCARERVVPGETVVLESSRRTPFRIPPDAKPGARLWRELEGQWIDFTVVALADVDLRLDGDDLVVGATSHLATPEDFEIHGDSDTVVRRLEPESPADVKIPLGPPLQESEDVLSVRLSCGDLVTGVERGLRTSRGHRELAALPRRFASGLRIRQEPEKPELVGTGAYVAPREQSCGDVVKAGLAMHPPYETGVGYVFALYEPVMLPDTPPAAFRAQVGKGDGSDPGDGILYRFVVMAPDGEETEATTTVVREHAWRPIEADLSRWAGEAVRLKLIADVGPADNSSGDWACWAGARIETLKPELVRTLVEDSRRYRKEPGPHEIRGLPVDTLRQARSGWLCYEGKGLAGGGEYATYGVLNGISLDSMAPAAGDEARGGFAEARKVLPPEVLRSLDRRNTFVLQNPRKDFFSVRRFWLELELSDGRRCSSEISTATYSSPPTWAHAEGILVPHPEDIEVTIWFPE